MKPASQRRLLALDVLRGITVAGMILVNNPGSWGNLYAPLAHAEWNGLTPTDLVFPFFMFIMGISACFSLKKYEYKFTGESVWKIVRRTVLILLIGWAITWFATFLRRVANPDYEFVDAVFNFGSMRLLGVFPRLALCYGAASLLAMLMMMGGGTMMARIKRIGWLVLVMLIAYAFMLVFGHGYEFSDDNIISVVDHAVVGAKHMYTDAVGGVRLNFDPEGLLSTLPSIAHCLIGFMCGGMIMCQPDLEKRALNLFIIGAILTMAGFLLNYGLPLNKKVWSPSFVITTCGLASSLLGLLIWIIDIKGHKKWCSFFEVYGINPLFLYVFATVAAVLLGFIKVHSGDANISLHAFIYKDFLVPLCLENMKLASLAYALLFVMFNWCVGLILYKKKIYIKI